MKITFNPITMMKKTFSVIAAAIIFVVIVGVVIIQASGVDLKGLATFRPSAVDTSKTLGLLKQCGAKYDETIYTQGEGMAYSPLTFSQLKESLQKEMSENNGNVKCPYSFISYSTIDKKPTTLVVCKGNQIKVGSDTISCNKITSYASVIFDVFENTNKLRVDVAYESKKSMANVLISGMGLSIAKTRKDLVDSTE